jgi:hypothetical protein
VTNSARGASERRVGGRRELKREPSTEALERALMHNPHLRDAPIEEVARQLMLGGYLHEEPSPGLVGDAMALVIAEEQAFGPDVLMEEG